MGFRFRKWLSSKGLKLYEGKSGVTSTSYRIAKGITYNTKRGLTIEIPGTDLRYNFGKRKSKASTRKQQTLERYNKSMENNLTGVPINHCKSCDKKINKGAARCPYCGEQQRNFKKILPSLLIMALLCFMLKVYTEIYTVKSEISRNSQSINTHM